MISGAKRKAATRAFIAAMSEKFPLAISGFEGRRRPLKIGIAADVVAGMPGVPPRGIYNALRSFYCNAGYLKSMSHAGAARIDLDGNPAGVVTALEAGGPAKEVASRIFKAAARKAAARPECSKPAPVPAGPRRLGLADLRQMKTFSRAGMTREKFNGMRGRSPLHGIVGVGDVQGPEKWPRCGWRRSQVEKW